jgi:hypothetical protein
MKQLVPSENFNTGARTQPARPSRRSNDSVLNPPPGAERRRFLRWPVFWSAELDSGERARNCQVLDFSPGGAKVRSADGPPIGGSVALKFPNAIHLFGKVAWAHGGLLGIEFQDGQLPWLRLPDPPRPAMRLVVDGTNPVLYDQHMAPAARATGPPPRLQSEPCRRFGGAAPHRSTGQRTRR